MKNKSEKLKKLFHDFEHELAKLAKEPCSCHQPAMDADLYVGKDDKLYKYETTPATPEKCARCGLPKSEWKGRWQRPLMGGIGCEGSKLRYIFRRL